MLTAPALLQENVLFGKPYDPDRYDAVLKACALEGAKCGSSCCLHHRNKELADVQWLSPVCQANQEWQQSSKISTCTAITADDVAALPAGSETELGERGINLSGALHCALLC